MTVVRVGPFMDVGRLLVSVLGTNVRGEIFVRSICVSRYVCSATARRVGRVITVVFTNVAWLCGQSVSAYKHNRWRLFIFRDLYNVLRRPLRGRVSTPFACVDEEDFVRGVQPLRCLPTIAKNVIKMSAHCRQVRCNAIRQFFHDLDPLLRPIRTCVGTVKDRRLTVLRPPYMDFRRLQEIFLDFHLLVGLIYRLGGYL